MLKVASWNVNSIKMRLEQVLLWLQQTDIDVLALQETKTINEMFPRERIEEAGYHVVFSGQKTYNGVAILSKRPLSDITTEIPDFGDPQRRVLAATVGDIRIVNVYVPNGSSLASEKYHYKLEWLAKVKEFIRSQMEQFPKLIMLGDYNIAPGDKDVHDPVEWEGSVLVSEPERQAFRAICALGLQDSYRLKHPEESAFSWWDYRAAAFRRNRGLRIDLVLLSQPLVEILQDANIDKAPRKWEKPSDHAPVWVELTLKN